MRHCRAKVPAADVYVSDIRDPDVHVADLDLVLSCDVLSIAGIRESLAGMTRLVGRLRRGGLLILNLPAFAWLRSRHDVATDTRDRITARQMRQLLTELGPVDRSHQLPALFSLSPDPPGPPALDASPNMGTWRPGAIGG